MYYLASCSMVKNEYDMQGNYSEKAPIYQFISIHRQLGVEKFLIFDRSDPPLSKYLGNDKDIKIINFPENDQNRHARAWMEGTKYFCNEEKSLFVQYIDIDQVAFPIVKPTLRDFLQDYEDCPAIGLNCQTFGSSNLEKEPDYTYSSFIKRAKDDNKINHIIQTIGKPDKIKQTIWSNPHGCLLINPNDRIMNENHQPIPPDCPFNVPTSQNKAFICHYYTHSQEWWEKKKSKGRADTGTAYEHSDIHDFDDCNEIEDTRVKDFWEKKCR
jgi:hypothetical protein